MAGVKLWLKNIHKNKTKQNIPCSKFDFQVTSPRFTCLQHKFSWASCNPQTINGSKRTDAGCNFSCQDSKVLLISQIMFCVLTPHQTAERQGPMIDKQPCTSKPNVWGSPTASVATQWSVTVHFALKQKNKKKKLSEKHSQWQKQTMEVIMFNGSTHHLKRHPANLSLYIHLITSTFALVVKIKIKKVWLFWSSLQSRGYGCNGTVWGKRQISWK